MSNIKATEEVKQAILKKITSRLAEKAKETVCASNHGAHMSCHSSHGNRLH